MKKKTRGAGRMQRWIDEVMFVIVAVLSAVAACVGLSASVVAAAAAAAASESPALNGQQIPGNLGARSMDWAVGQQGNFSYSYPFSVPEVPGISMNLAMVYDAAAGDGDGGPFWKFDLPALELAQQQKGGKRMLSPAECRESRAVNLRLNGAPLAPRGAGVWALTGSFGIDLVKCAGEGFVLHRANGDVVEFGGDANARVADSAGRAVAWKVTRISRAGWKGEVRYRYQRKQRGPIWGYPLLESIKSADVSVRVEAGDEPGLLPDFRRQIFEARLQRVAAVVVEKNGQRLRRYAFDYEGGAQGRLQAISEFGRSDSAVFPGTKFSYVAQNRHDTAANVEWEQVGQLHIETERVRLHRSLKAQFVGLGQTPQPMLVYINSQKQLEAMDFAVGSVLANPQTVAVRLQDERASAPPELNDVTWADFDGNGTADVVLTGGHIPGVPGYRVFFNDLQLPEGDGGVVFSRSASVRDASWRKLHEGCQPGEIVAGDFDGDGLDDLTCPNINAPVFLLNRGVIAQGGDWIIEFEVVESQGSIGRSWRDDNIDAKSLRVVDWNQDGLVDFVTVNPGGRFRAYLNKGMQENGNLDFLAATIVDESGFHGRTLEDVGIADVDGNGLPDLVFMAKVRGKFLQVRLNFGFGVPPVAAEVAGVDVMSPESLRIADLDADGRAEILFQRRHDTDPFSVVRIKGSPYPNLLASVGSSSGLRIGASYDSVFSEHLRAVQQDKDVEVAQAERDRFLSPIAFPVVKQVSRSDGFSPTEETFWAYRAPAFDFVEGSFSGFAVVRRLLLGDESQPSTLQETRATTGYRASESKLIDPRLPSELEHVDGIEGCAVSGALWCRQSAGAVYMTREGAALNVHAHETGEFARDQRIVTAQSRLLIVPFGGAVGPVQPEVESQLGLAGVLEVSRAETVAGGKFRHLAERKTIESFEYDSFGRMAHVRVWNDAEDSSDDLLREYDYDCEGTSDNPLLYCLGPTRVVETADAQTFAIHNLYERGLLAEVKQTDQSGALAWQFSSKFDDFGRAIERKDVAGRFDEFIWSASGAELLQTRDVWGVVVDAEYNSLGDMLVLRSNRGAYQEFGYDAWGRVIEEMRRPEGATAAVQVAGYRYRFPEVSQGLQGLQRAAGFVEVWARNRETEELRLASKVWLSGSDVVLAEGKRVDEDGFLVALSGDRNRRGNFRTVFLNKRVNRNDMESLIASLPQQREKPWIQRQFYFYGAVRQDEWSDGRKLVFDRGVDFTAKTTPEGRTTEQIFDRRGRLVGARVGLGAEGSENEATLSLEAARDSRGRIVSLVDNDGLRVSQTYGPDGDVLDVFNNRFGSLRNERDEAGRVVRVKRCSVKDGERCGADMAQMTRELTYVNDAIASELARRFESGEAAGGVSSEDRVDYMYGATAGDARSIGRLARVVANMTLGSGVSGSAEKSFEYDSWGRTSVMSLNLAAPSAEVGMGENLHFELRRFYDLQGNVIDVQAGAGEAAEQMQIGVQRDYFDGTGSVRSVSASDGTRLNQRQLLGGVVFNHEGQLAEARLGASFVLSACWKRGADVPVGFALARGVVSGCPTWADNELVAGSLLSGAWNYDSDELSTGTRLSGFERQQWNQYGLDVQGRLVSVSSSLGQIEYRYSPGGRILQVKRLGRFVSGGAVGRDATGDEALAELLSVYRWNEDESQSPLDGLVGVEHLARLSGGAEVSGIERFVTDSMGYRLRGAEPALPRFGATTGGSVGASAEQRYEWSGRGALVGIATETSRGVVRLADESGSVIAEWSGGAASGTAGALRMVALADDVTWNRGELSIRVPFARGLATLRHVVKAPVGTENSGNNGNKSRDELIVSQQSGTASVAVDLDDGKLISWNEREPYGLHVGAGNYSDNSGGADDGMRPGEGDDEGAASKSQGRFASNILIAGAPRDVRDFGKGLFSSDVGLHSMGLRAYDPARGVWLSPDPLLAANPQLCIISPRQCNLYAYAANNPVFHTDSSGLYVDKDGNPFMGPPSGDPSVRQYENRAERDFVENSMVTTPSGGLSTSRTGTFFYSTWSDAQGNKKISFERITTVSPEANLAGALAVVTGTKAAAAVAPYVGATVRGAATKAVVMAGEAANLASNLSIRAWVSGSSALTALGAKSRELYNAAASVVRQEAQLLGSSARDVARYVARDVMTHGPAAIEWGGGMLKGYSDPTPPGSVSEAIGWGIGEAEKSYDQYSD